MVTLRNQWQKWESNPDLCLLSCWTTVLLGRTRSKCSNVAVILNSQTGSQHRALPAALPCAWSSDKLHVELGRAHLPSTNGSSS